jgi:N-acyl-D-aspartate/D-glutamate deacylase
MSLPEAIHKVSGFPAAILGLEGRGLLKEGYWADLVLLDPGKVVDRSTYEQPEQYPEGIPYVMVNGRLVVDGSETTGRLPGQALRK